MKYESSVSTPTKWVEEIKVYDSGCSDNDRGIYLTIDMDWACSEVLEDTHNIISKYGIKSTWFVTNNDPYLEDLRRDTSVSLGIHPNINPLLAADSKELDTQRCAETIVDSLLKLAPDAKVVRSHSLASGSYLTGLFKRKGLTHESNFKIPLFTGVDFPAFQHVSGMIVCPFLWDDYSDATVELPDNSILPRISIINFHPIHIFLNTARLDLYERTRPIHSNPEELIKHRFKGSGARTRLIELLENQLN